jgi:hypothetical protein
MTAPGQTMTKLRLTALTQDLCTNIAKYRPVALEIGLEGGQFVSALAYAGSEGWLADAPRRGWTSLTRAGAAIARR